MRRAPGRSFAFAVALFTGCGTYGSEDVAPASDAGPSGSDVDAGAVDSGIPVPEKGFTVTVAPAHVTADRGDSIVSINVTVTRAKDFTDAVEVLLNGPPPLAGITNPSPLVVAGASTGGPISFAISNDATDGDYTVDVLGTGGGITSEPAKLGLRIGSMLATATSKTTINLPSYATKVDVVMWGGGGAGAPYNTSGVGGTGGAGGFTSARVPVDAKVPLLLVVGTAGSVLGFHGGGGGGYSSIEQGSTILAIAGGGGGGGVGSYGAAHDGAPGHNSTLGTKACARGGNATTTTAGAAGGIGDTTGIAGGPRAGGGGMAVSDSPGGFPGGGKSFDKAGGGGAGQFGGGSGGTCSTTVGGGGGGSGFAIAGSENVVFESGTGAAPAQTTRPEYGASNAATGGAAGSYDTSTNPKAGTSGRIVVRLAKP